MGFAQRACCGIWARVLPGTICTTTGRAHQPVRGTRLMHICSGQAAVTQWWHALWLLVLGLFTPAHVPACMPRRNDKWRGLCLVPMHACMHAYEQHASNRCRGHGLIIREGGCGCHMAALILWLLCSYTDACTHAGLCCRWLQLLSQHSSDVCFVGCAPFCPEMLLRCHTFTTRTPFPNWLTVRPHALVTCCKSTRNSGRMAACAPG